MEEFRVVDPASAPACRAMGEYFAERMWVAADARGHGIARALLAHLESLILAAGRTESLLDTNGSLTAAVSLYESSGYRSVPDYNGNPDANVWFAKVLG